MTKQELVNEISLETGVDRATVLSVVEAFMSNVKKSVTEGDNVYLRGFGSFIQKKMATKTARNITKNTAIIIPEHMKPAFKPSKDFVEMMTK